MIMARNEDGTYSQVGFVKDNVGIDTEYIYDKDGDIVFEKGFTRETSGTVPLTINGIGKDLKAWSITGNTVQNGTPAPDTPQEVKAVGDRTGNLFDGTICIDNVILSQYGNLTPNNSYALSEYIPVEPNMSYIYHFYHNIAENRSTYSICEYDSNQNVIQPLTVQWITENRDYNISFTTQANTAYIRINWKKAPDDDLMLITGSTPLPYEPYGYKIPVVTSADGTEPITTPIYLDKPLYKIGDYADSINYAEQKVERVVKELVLTGKENWYYMPNYDVENTVRIHSSEILPDRKGTMLDLCSHFERMDYHSLNVSNKPAFSIASGTQLVFRVSKAEGSAVTYFKSYLAAQYAAGTPVKVYYVMKTPETNTVEPVEIPTINGTTVIDVDTAVKPTEMYTKYKSSK